MFFYLSKILGYLINPLGWIIIFLFLALISRKPKKKIRMLVVSFVFLILFTNPFLGDEAISRWEYPLKSTSAISHNIKTYPAGVLLCGDIASYDKKSDRIVFRSGADRLMQTIDLYQKKLIAKIIISGGSGHLIYKDRTEASFIKKYLVGIGITPDDIIFETRSKNTYENAKFSKELLIENHISDSIVLITSALHMKRAKAVFEKQGIKVIDYSTSKITGERLINIDHLFVPSVVALMNWNQLIHEVTGYWVYKIMGYC